MPTLSAHCGEQATFLALPAFADASPIIIAIPGLGTAALTHFTTDEQRVYRLLYTKGRLHIEQERIPFAHVSDAVQKRLGDP